MAKRVRKAVLSTKSKLLEIAGQIIFGLSCLGVGSGLLFLIVDVVNTISGQHLDPDALPAACRGSDG